MNIDITVIIDQMIILFLMMLLGGILNKAGMFDVPFQKKLSKLLINVTVPCLILHSVLQQADNRDIHTALTVGLIAVITYILLPVIAFIFVWIFHVPTEDKGLYMLMTVYSNVGFMGFPVLDALFGATAVFYAGIFNVVFNLSIYTIGIIMIHYGRSEKAPISLKSLLSPGILLSVFAIAVYFLDIKIPNTISSTIASVGALTVPLAMMIIGATLAAMNLKELFNDWRLYPYTLFRQFLLPLGAFYLLRFFIHDTFILGVSSILLMMPVANTTVLYANEYGGNEKTAAKTVFSQHCCL